MKGTSGTLQDGKAVMPVWTTNHDVEWGVKASPRIQMALSKDTRCYDLEGNERRVDFAADGLVRVPLTPAPLFFVASDAAALLAALREAVAEDPSTALSVDVRPNLEGKVRLIVQNETKAEDPSFVPYRDSGLPFTPGALYNFDGSLEIYFDGFGDARTQGEKDYDLNDSRYDFCEGNVHRLLAVNWQLAQGTASATDEEVREKLVRTFTRTATGYVYEIAFAARYMAPIDLKPGTVAGFGIALHDWNGPKGGEAKRMHATFSSSTRPGTDINKKPYLMPLMVLGE